MERKQLIIVIAIATVAAIIYYWDEIQAKLGKKAPATLPSGATATTAPALPAAADTSAVDATIARIEAELAASSNQQQQLEAAASLNPTPTTVTAPPPPTTNVGNQRQYNAINAGAYGSPSPEMIEYLRNAAKRYNLKTPATLASKVSGVRDWVKNHSSYSSTHIFARYVNLQNSAGTNASNALILKDITDKQAQIF